MLTIIVAFLTISILPELLPAVSGVKTRPQLLVVVTQVINKRWKHFAPG